MQSNSNLIVVVALTFPLFSACQHRSNSISVDQMDVIANKLTIIPNFELRTITGTQITTLKTRKTGQAEIVFSPNSLIIKSAMINGNTASHSSTPAGVTFKLPINAGANQILRLEVNYEAVPNRGFSFNETGVITSYFACNWMLCRQDTPSDKSTLALNVVVPSDVGVIGTGDHISTSTLPGVLKLHHWYSSGSFSPYLFGFAIGQFETLVVKYKDRELAYVNATGEVQPMERLFGTTPAIADFFANKAGMPLPPRRYTQILEVGTSAQEFSAYSVIGTSNINPILTDSTEDWVIAHELAHQWWGNSLTCASWQDFWLNEGITVFMTAAWKEHRHGRAAYDRELEIARARWTRAKDAGWDRPLTFGGQYPSLGIRRAIQYSKGALFMDHLRTTVGEDAFWRGLKNYTRSNAGKSVASKDLQTSMERASRRDLTTIFDEWVYTQNN